MTFTVGGPQVWSIPPDWGTPVRESLAWSTDVLQASATGTTQHRGLRDTPRRSFAFDVLANHAERRLADALLADGGGRRWLLPIWPDVQHLTIGVAAADLEIQCRTVGFDFQPGGKALLWRGINDWKVVDIDAVTASRLELAIAPGGNWAPGVRLYPLRSARLEARSSIQTITDTAARPRLSFAIAEPCDWPAALPATTYLGHPVLTDIPDFADDQEVQYPRLLSTLDNGTALPFTTDLAGRAFRTTRSAWELWGRPQQAAFRGLLYGLDGRRVPLWVPTWQQDLRLASAASAVATTISVEWAGYTLFGRQQPNRRDIAIHLAGGTVLYRRITASAQAGQTETLTLSSALGVAITPAQVRRISFMDLSTLASDQIDIEHMTDSDGRARAITPWQAVVPDV